MPVQQQSAFQLSKPSDVLHQKEHWDVQLLLVRGGGSFPENSVHGFSDWIGSLCSVNASWEVHIGSSSLCGFLDAFELQPLGLWNQKKSSLSVFSSIIWVSLPENYILDRVAFVAFLMLSEFELQPLGLGIKKSSLPVYSSIIWVSSYSSWIYFPKFSPTKKGWCEHWNSFSMLSVKRNKTHLEWNAQLIFRTQLLIQILKVRQT